MDLQVTYLVVMQVQSVLLRQRRVAFDSLNWEVDDLFKGQLVVEGIGC